MKISIITATYNSEKTIVSALETLRSQDYPNIEWIVVDGASKDNTVNIIRSGYNGNVVIKSEKDKGIYDALNKGIQMSTGDVIGFLHSDDLFADSSVISEIARHFENPAIDGIYGDLQYISAVDPSKIIRNWKSNDFRMRSLTRGWMPAHPTLFLRKDVYKKHGDFASGYSISADYDFILRIFKDSALRFRYLPVIITKMRTGGASNNLSGIRRKMSEDLRAIRHNKIGVPYFVLFFKNFRKLKQLLK